MLLFSLFACTAPGSDDTGRWNGGQTGSESAECGEETRSELSRSERPELWERTEGSWERSFVWADAGGTEPLSLDIDAEDSATAVVSASCGSWTELGVQLSFELEGGAFDEDLALTLKTDTIDTDVLQAWEELEQPAGSWGDGAVRFYFAFPHPDRGPVGTLSNSAGSIGDW